MQERYEPAIVEPQAQRDWTSRAPSRLPRIPPANNYRLCMFPYPKRPPARWHVADLHHDRRRDIHALMARMQGYNAPQPTGLERVRPACRTTWPMANGVPPAKNGLPPEHRIHEAADAAARPRDQLEPRGHAAVLDHRRTRALFCALEKGIAYRKTGVVVGIWSTNRARQGAAGDRRPRLRTVAWSSVRSR